jgi:hypothetical protein
MTAEGFRRIALGMPGAVEGAHMAHPDFRTAAGKIFATLQADGVRGMVTLTPDQQAERIADHPGVFEPASGAWGRQGCTMVRLDRAGADVVGEAITVAWQHASRARTGPRRRAAPRASAAPPSGAAAQATRKNRRPANRRR